MPLSPPTPTTHLHTVLHNHYSLPPFLSLFPSAFASHPMLILLMSPPWRFAVLVSTSYFLPSYHFSFPLSSHPKTSYLSYHPPPPALFHPFLFSHSPVFSFFICDPTTQSALTHQSYHPPNHPRPLLVHLSPKQSQLTLYLSNHSRNTTSLSQIVHLNYGS